VADAPHRRKRRLLGAEGRGSGGDGASVRKARRRSGLSTLSWHAGRNVQPFLSNIEHGRSNAQCGHLYKLASALGVGASELLPRRRRRGVVVVRAG